MRAISTFTFDAGMSTRRCFDPQALRMRVNTSEIGSVMLISDSCCPSYPLQTDVWDCKGYGREYQGCLVYQLAFRTPGMNPFSDRSRKQMRHSPNLRRNARERPQRWQRLCWRTANFGFRLLFSIMALRAI